MLDFYLSLNDLPFNCKSFQKKYVFEEINGLFKVAVYSNDFIIIIVIIIVVLSETLCL